MVCLPVNSEQHSRNKQGAHRFNAVLKWKIYCYQKLNKNPIQTTDKITLQI